MGKILGSWSGMRKYLEEEMLADALKGRIRCISILYFTLFFDIIFI